MWKNIEDEEVYCLFYFFTRVVFLASLPSHPIPGSGTGRDSAKAQRQGQQVTTGERPQARTPRLGRGLVTPQRLLGGAAALPLCGRGTAPSVREGAGGQQAKKGPVVFLLHTPHDTPMHSFTHSLCYIKVRPSPLSDRPPLGADDIQDTMEQVGPMDVNKGVGIA